MINWKSKNTVYQEETLQDVIDRINVQASFGYGFTIKMSSENFKELRNIINAKLMAPVTINNVTTVLILSEGKKEDELNQQVIA